MARALFARVVVACSSISLIVTAEKRLRGIASKGEGNPALRASTTNFAFGASTACGCNGKSATQKLAEHGFVGVAAPDWLASPFQDTQGAPASGGDTFDGYQDTTFFSNCASGDGGCGRCWQLDTTGEENIYKQKPDASYSVKVVVLDICEDRNAYGDNYQWCVAAKDVPAGGIVTDYNGHCANNDCGFGQYLKLGDFTTDGNVTSWSAPDCMVDGEWVCTNLAGYPYHFDLASTDLDEATIARLRVWPKGLNPIVTATKITCPDEVLQDLKDSCGANSKEDPTSDEALNICQYYCKGSTDPATNYTKSWIPSYWGGCDNDASCAPPHTQCGGKDWSGPTCCQWGETCQKYSDYYSGCCKEGEC